MKTPKIGIYHELISDLRSLRAVAPFITSKIILLPMAKIKAFRLELDRLNHPHAWHENIALVVANKLVCRDSYPFDHIDSEQQLYGTWATSDYAINVDQLDLTPLMENEAA